MALGTWLLYLASRTAPADAQRVMADFLAEQFGVARTGAEGPREFDR